MMPDYHESHINEDGPDSIEDDDDGDPQLDDNYWDPEWSKGEEDDEQ